MTFPRIYKQAFITMLLIVCIQSSFAQASLFSREQYIGAKNDTLNYRILTPDYDTMRRYPLVIFLHGSGERGNDNESQLKWGVMNFATGENMKLHPAIIIAPQCPEGQTWSNFSSNIGDRTDMKLLPAASKPMQLVLDLIKDVTKKFLVDTNRIYITGLSMGGYGTYDVLERYPNMFAAAVPVCGGGDVSKAASIAKVPIWIFHGSEDPAVPAILSYMMVGALTKAGAHPGFTQYPETGHFSWIAAYSDPMMIEWMFRQRKK